MVVAPRANAPGSLKERRYAGVWGFLVPALTVAGPSGVGRVVAGSVIFRGRVGHTENRYGVGPCTIAHSCGLGSSTWMGCLF